MNLLTAIALLLPCLCRPWASAGESPAPAASSPTTVVRACLERANKFDYLGAAKFFDTGSLGVLQANETFKPLMDTWTRKGSVAEFVVLREAIKDDRAVVSAGIKFADGGLAFDDRTLLILRNGIWKIVSTDSFNPPRPGPTGTIE